MPNTLRFDLILTPSGRLRLKRTAPEAAGKTSTWEKKVFDAFSVHPAPGLLALATSRPDTRLPSSVSFWRDFGCRYLTSLCRTPESAGDMFDPIDPPGRFEIEAILFNAPPMEGGEYLNAERLLDLWMKLDGWVREDIASSRAGLSGWLKKHAPLWQQVGRVCFHLAENKRNPELPFAFLATYAPHLSKDGQVQYQPLGRALKEYAGRKNKKALIHLLSPVEAAAGKSVFIRQLVDSGDVFHPVAWSPKEAYRFLKDIPLLEESGLLVRHPDWWRKRPRPRVVVTMGEKKQTSLAAGSMLDFRVDIALGDEKLTEDEWRRLMSE
ncbi:MAG TPA: ATP-dependent helicase, partial [Desulfobacteraceae bacterium]|nr:ATP-dependent helicase [Desulfobacteraceae bacterium]